jgi:hypothetical protein
MALNFPNRSRSYDVTRRAVRFWGHDGPMEATFFVNEDALRRIEPGVGGSGRGLRFTLVCDRGEERPVPAGCLTSGLVSPRVTERHSRHSYATAIIE